MCSCHCVLLHCRTLTLAPAYTQDYSTMLNINTCVLVSPDIKYSVAGPQCSASLPWSQSSELAMHVTCTIGSLWVVQCRGRSVSNWGESRFWKGDPIATFKGCKGVPKNDPFSDNRCEVIVREEGTMCTKHRSIGGIKARLLWLSKMAVISYHQ